MSFITERDRYRKFEIKHFGVSHTSDKPLPNHIEAQVFNPADKVFVTRYIEKYPAVEGRVIAAEWYQREDKNGGQVFRGYELTIDIDDEVIVLDVPYKRPPTPIYSLLVKHGENVDWSKRLKISAWETKNDQGKPKTGVCFWQKDDDGKDVSIKSAHTRENPNGCPEPVFDDDTQELDWRAVERWLRKNFEEKVIPRIKEAAQGYKPAERPKATQAAIVIKEEDEPEAPKAKAAIVGQSKQKSQPDDPFGDDWEPVF